MSLSRNRILVWALATILVVGICVAACAVTAKDVENKLRAKVTEKWHTDNLRVTVVPYDSQARTNKGQFAKIFVAADAAQQKEKHIRIVEFEISAKDVDLDLDALMNHNEVTVQSEKLSSCHVKLMKDDVNRLLALKDTPIENLRAEFGNNEITFSGKYHFNIKLTGTLEVKNTYEIWFKPTQASIGILSIPTGIVNQFLSKMNPIVDMRDVPLRPRIKVINIRPTYIGFGG
jgi:hypothetical protein